MSCIDIKSRLDQYITDELDKDTAQEVREHLIECADCRADYEALKALKAELKALAEPVPDDFEEGLIQKIQKSKRVSPFNVNKFAVSAVAAVVLICVIGVGIGTSYNQGLDNKIDILKNEEASADVAENTKELTQATEEPVNETNEYEIGAEETTLSLPQVAVAGEDYAFAVEANTVEAEEAADAVEETPVVTEADDSEGSKFDTANNTVESDTSDAIKSKVKESTSDADNEAEDSVPVSGSGAAAQADADVYEIEQVDEAALETEVVEPSMPKISGATVERSATAVEYDAIVYISGESLAHITSKLYTIEGTTIIDQNQKGISARITSVSYTKLKYELRDYITGEEKSVDDSNSMDYTVSFQVK